MILQRQATARLLLLIAIAIGFALAWRQFRSIPMLVLGQPRVVGLLQKEQEAPFFRNLAASTGLPLAITYRTADTYGLKDSHQLNALREGRVDIVSLRFMQNIVNEPSLEGLDLPGMITDFELGRRVIKAYSPTVDRYLQTNFGSKLLGIWSFGPQVMLCRSRLSGLQDIRGRRVRVASPGLAQLVTAIGATAVILPFEDTKSALQLGLVDCAVTSAASANFAGWPDHTGYFYPLVFQFGFNGYAISLRRWNALSAAEQQRLQQAFDSFCSTLWRYSQDLQRESERCITAGPCLRQRQHRLHPVEVSREDMERLRNLSRQEVLPRWSVRCDQRNPGCSQRWDQLVAPIVMAGPSVAAQP